MLRKGWGTRTGTLIGVLTGVFLVLTILAGSTPIASAQEAAEEEGVKLLQSHSKAPYVHRITLYDHDGAAIDPSDEFAGPYSPKKTCGKCHPYMQIASGWHFNETDDSVSAGRPGEPWFLVDRETGTQLPVSGRKWPGTFTPEQAGLTHWQFVMRYGHHTPGGAFGEPSEEQKRASDKRMRWTISGELEIDCLFCHAGDQQHDPAEASRQIEQENFKWAPTTALALAVVRGEAAKAPDDWDPMMEPDPDHPEQAGPKLIWDLSRFDPDNRVLLNITRRPSADRCYFCHSFREVGAGATDDLISSRDVHLAAGMTCVDCHRNGLDHKIVRGYETEATERGEPEVAAFSCSGCHLDTDGEGGAPPIGGRYGAPQPQHRGLPPVHFEKLTCTACHSGPWPEEYAKRYQTSLAHGLGLATREREDHDLPHMVGPIFGRQHDGKIAPQRMVWPAYWGRITKGPFGSAINSPETIRSRLSAGKPDSNPGGLAPDAALEEELVAAILESDLENDDGRTPIYVRDGWIHSLSKTGELVRWNNRKMFEQLFEAVQNREHWNLPETPGSLEMARSYRWSIAHDVRPASQSMGIRGCTDCHSNSAPIDFGRPAAKGDVLADGRSAKTMLQLRVDEAILPVGAYSGENETLARAWTFGFRFRTAFKWFGFIVGGLVGLVLLHYLLAGVGALARRFG